MNDENAIDEAPGRRERFAAWRRGRPFWGGILTALAGVVLWFSGRLRLDGFEIQLGIEGMQSTLLPVVLVALGVLVMAQPQVRVFYGVITLAISVYSLLGVNLGGFGVGMVLGVVGGILAVSWLPQVAVPAESAAPSAAAPVDPAPDGEEEVCADELLPFDHEPAHGGRHVAVMAAVAVLAIGGTSATATEAAGAAPAQVGAAADCWDPLGWLEWICGDGDEAAATPSPSPSATGDAGAGGETGGTGDDAAGSGDDGAAGMGGPGDGAAEPGGEAVDAGNQSKGKGAGADGRKPASDDEPAPDEEAQQTVQDAAEVELGPCARITFGGGYDINVALPGDCGTPEDANVFSLDGELETRDLQLPLTGINGVGVVNVPVTTDGPRRDALKISVDEVKVPGFWLKTYADNDGKLGGTVTDADYVSMEGNAQMYISSIHANLPGGDDVAELGEKLASGASLVEMLLGLTDARIGLMGATSDVQVWSDFREQVWED
ncbi:hypothetical protein GCM10009809_10410 [Isoptericola hypogeus]|uniref:Secreted protein n=1 Tax=Isoptericola hypogeus TaxID=300179 RepID=A0ABP4V1U7_9MICO